MYAMQGAGTIGIVGGGQLGRMLTLAAKPLGFEVIVVNPSSNSPAAQVGAEEIVADLYDSAALKKLASRADYITIEIEHLNATALEAISKLGKPVNPSPNTIQLIQDKLKQKNFLKKSGISVSPFKEIKDEKSAQKILNKFGGKMFIKTRHGAYDGRGNMLVTSPKEVTNALAFFAGKELYAEAYVPFVKELAVMVARDMKNNVIAYPVVETIHDRNICVEVQAPANVSPLVVKRATALAKNVAKKLSGAGVFGIEMFLTKDGKVLVNEIAPRVHNSGHYTIEASRTSQFEQHIRAISGLPLGSTDMVVPAVVMINILGERNGKTKVSGLDQALGIRGISTHLYGKSPTKVDRKMGHITAIADTLETARRHARSARAKIDL
ncbi:MAG TPA: 5-(carboxyamino)imidazole ribonucleotide synthase [Patescibacteria group bacterium]|nr:5-(carboxyamino)imidazole ribonucleotide synthase [Patescibacteria group bacterium]